MFTKTWMSIATQIITSATQMIFNGWMNKQLRYSLIMECYWAIRRNKLLRGWVPMALYCVKEATFKSYILQDTFSMEFGKEIIEDCWLPWISDAWRVGSQRDRLREIVRMMEFFCNQFVAGVMETYLFVKTHGTVHQKQKKSFYFMLISKQQKAFIPESQLHCVILK